MPAKRPARAWGLLVAAIALVLPACELDQSYTRIVDPDTGAQEAVVIAMDFGKAANLPEGFNAAGVARTYVFGQEIRLTGTNLSRPPEGHYYALYLANTDGSGATHVADLTSPAPAYAPLRDADVQLIPPYVNETLVTEGVARTVAAGVDFGQFEEVWLVLAPKSGGEPTGVVAAKGTLPSSLTGG